MKKLAYITVLILFFSCGEEETFFEDLVTNIDREKYELVANGVDSLSVFIQFNSEASLENIKAKADLNNGVFLNSGKSTTELQPVRLPDNTIQSEIKIKSNTKNIDHILSINVNQFIDTVLIKSIKSEPQKISVKLSALSALNNFRSAISITGTLLNDEGRKVSEGVSVRFEAKSPDGSNANGTFNINNSSSNSSSMVSADFFPGDVQVGDIIIINLTVNDESGERTDISDSEQILIINE